jgi:hypothetical protein
VNWFFFTTARSTANPEDYVRVLAIRIKISIKGFERANMATSDLKSDKQFLHETRIGLHADNGLSEGKTPRPRHDTDVNEAFTSEHTPRPLGERLQRSYRLWMETVLAVVVCLVAIGVTTLFRTNPSTSLFCCLAAVAVTAQFARPGPRILVGVITAGYVAHYLSLNGSQPAASDFRLLFAIYIVVALFLCLHNRSHPVSSAADRSGHRIPCPTASPEEILDTYIKRIACADGDVSVPRKDIYAWMRECAHFRDLIWNIDDCWRRRDWNMLSHTIRVAYRQVAHLEQTLLQNSLEALQDQPVSDETAQSSAIEPAQPINAAAETA